MSEVEWDECGMCDIAPLISCYRSGDGVSLCCGDNASGGFDLSPFIARAVAARLNQLADEIDPPSLIVQDNSENDE